jgi:hypothetical protein
MLFKYFRASIKHRYTDILIRKSEQYNSSNGTTFQELGRKSRCIDVDTITSFSNVNINDKLNSSLSSTDF